VDEYRERQAELVAVEGSLRFADDHRVEASGGVLERLKETGGSGRRFHGNDRDWPMSKNSSTISPPAASMTWRDRTSCQLRDDAGSCWSSVLTRP
jgi:hypothetical protein